MSGEWTVGDTATCLRRPTPADDKYSRGVVGLRTGSERYPGAAILGIEAAWRTGVGMVRYLGPATPRSLVLARRPETVVADGRAQSWVIGSGTDAATRDDHETAALRGILSGEVPVVVDAGALDLAVDADAPLVVTPHAREHQVLRATPGLLGGDDSVETARALGAVVLLKGSVTKVASPDGSLITVTSPTSWLATAGTGDVLAGILGAVVAGAVADGRASDATSLAPFAATAAWLHAHAAQLASDRWRGGPITALDVAEAVPLAVADALSHINT